MLNDMSAVYLLTVRDLKVEISSAQGSLSTKEAESQLGIRVGRGA
jgi:hypothetical protein